MAKLRHIALIVPDPEKAAKFFEDAFDMKVAGKARRGLYVSDGVMNVTEDLTIDASHLENGRGSRVTFFPSGTDFRFVGITDDRGGLVPATTNRSGEQVKISWSFPPTGTQRFLIRYDVTGAVRVQVMDLPFVGRRVARDAKVRGVLNPVGVRIEVTSPVQVVAAGRRNNRDVSVRRRLHACRR